MKLLRHGPPGHERPGLLAADGTLRDLSHLLADIAPPHLDPEALARLAASDPATLPVVEQPVRLGPCVGGVGKIVAVGLNYRSLATVTALPLPDAPVIFLKAASALCGAADPLEIPPGATAIDWEVELAVVIGRRARRIAPADALAHVAGYCIINDLSERSWQFGSTAGLSGHRGTHNGGQWDKGKNHDGFAPLGPWLVTADEVADPHALDLWLDIDGQRMQAANTADLLFAIPRLIADISRYLTLQPGDVIATGTPPGSGFLRQPPQYLRPGQTMRAGITGLGEQCQQVLAAAESATPGAAAHHGLQLAGA